MEENMQYDDLGTLAQLNWFPGHMAKAKRIIVENLKLVDVVIELRDARIPNSSANPILKDLIGKEPQSHQTGCPAGFRVSGSQSGLPEICLRFWRWH